MIPVVANQCKIIQVWKIFVSLISLIYSFSEKDSIEEIKLVFLNKQDGRIPDAKKDDTYLIRDIEHFKDNVDWYPLLL